MLRNKWMDELWRLFQTNPAWKAERGKIYWGRSFDYELPKMPDSFHMRYEWWKHSSWSKKWDPGLDYLDSRPNEYGWVGAVSTWNVGTMEYWVQRTKIWFFFCFLSNKPSFQYFIIPIGVKPLSLIFSFISKGGYRIVGANWRKAETTIHRDRFPNSSEMSTMLLLRKGTG